MKKGLCQKTFIYVLSVSFLLMMNEDESFKFLQWETTDRGNWPCFWFSTIPFDKLKSRAVKIEFQGGKIPVVSIRDLIELKKRVGRKQDLADVEHLKLLLEKWWEEKRGDFVI